MIIILDDQPIPTKVGLTDITFRYQLPRRVRQVRTYALKGDDEPEPRYVFVSEHYETV